MEQLDSYAGFDGFPNLPIPSTILIELQCTYVANFIPEYWWHVLLYEK